MCSFCRGQTLYKPRLSVCDLPILLLSSLISFSLTLYPCSMIVHVQMVWKINLKPEIWTWFVLKQSDGSKNQRYTLPFIGTFLFYYNQQSNSEWIWGYYLYTQVFTAKPIEVHRLYTRVSLPVDSKSGWSIINYVTVWWHCQGTRYVHAKYRMFLNTSTIHKQRQCCGFSTVRHPNNETNPLVLRLKNGAQTSLL